MMIISWRDIPAQVAAESGGKREKILLTARFQDAIDRAAAVAGLTETTAYVQEWHRQVEPLQGEIRSQLKALAASIESSYDNEALEELVRNGGQAKIGKDEVNGLRH
ncbi:MAG: virulence factor [Actinomycetota bacterium]|jgi:hypothetical protein|nr:virulence factor [Actinomycetota bacterium]MEE3256549.1 virulence factor [Actinomycetota bacterium]